MHTLKSKKSLLVSCGGGIVEKDVNLALMREMGVIVFLDGDLSDSLRQIQRTDRRPDLEALKTLLSFIDACARVMRPLLILLLIFVRKRLSR